MLFITGATGFVGSHLLKALQKDAVEARCLVRTEEKAKAVQSLGFDAVIGDITDRESLTGKLKGIELVVHLVGIIQEGSGITFNRVHVEGTENLINEALSAGVKNFFYQSALGADLESPFKYLKTKAEAEELLKISGLNFWIFRPSLIIGPGDGFTENIKELLRLSPVVPVPGSGNAKFQPLSIDDWVRAFMKTLKNSSSSGTIYEFGGPEHLTYNEILQIIMKEMGIKKPLVHIPVGIVKAGIPLTYLFRKLGVKIPPVSAEQLNLLQKNNITDIDSMEKHFGFKPESFETAIKKAI